MKTFTTLCHVPILVWLSFSYFKTSVKFYSYFSFVWTLGYCSS